MSKEKKTQCECPLAGYCKRHNMVKGPHPHKLCQTREDYFQLWEEGFGPGQGSPENVASEQQKEEIQPIVSENTAKKIIEENTAEEKKKRGSRAIKGLIAGMTLGAGGSSGFSFLRRAKQAAKDAKEAPEQAKMYLTPLTEYIDTLKGSVSASKTQPLQGNSDFFKKKRITEGEKILEEIKGKLSSVESKAKKARSQRLYGGSFWLQPSTPQPKGSAKMPSTRTAHGQVIKAIFGRPEGLDEAVKGPKHLRGFYEKLIERNVDPSKYIS